MIAMRNIAAVVLLTLAPIAAHAQFPTNTSIKMVNTASPSPDFGDFSFKWRGYEDQAVTLVFTNLSPAPQYAVFKASRKIAGTTNVAYITKNVGDITVSGTTCRFSVSHGEIPPDGTYLAEIRAVTAETNTLRVLGQGKIQILDSLFDDADGTWAGGGWTNLLEYLTKAEAAALYLSVTNIFGSSNDGTALEASSNLAQWVSSGVTFEPTNASARAQVLATNAYAAAIAQAQILATNAVAASASSAAASYATIASLSAETVQRIGSDSATTQRMDTIDISIGGVEDTVQEERIERIGSDNALSNAIPLKLSIATAGAQYEPTGAVARATAAAAVLFQPTNAILSNAGTLFEPTGAVARATSGMISSNSAAVTYHPLGGSATVSLTASNVTPYSVTLLTNIVRGASGGRVTVNSGDTVAYLSDVSAPAGVMLLDQSTPQTVTGGSPTFSAGIKVGYTNNMNGVRVNVTPVDVPGYFGYLDGSWTYSGSTNYYNASFSGEVSDVGEIAPGATDTASFAINVGRIGGSQVGLSFGVDARNVAMSFFNEDELNTTFLSVIGDVTTIPKLRVESLGVSPVYPSSTNFFTGTQVVLLQGLAQSKTNTYVNGLLRAY